MKTVGLQLAHMINVVLIYGCVGQSHPVRWSSVGTRSSFFCWRSSCIGRWSLVSVSLVDFCKFALMWLHAPCVQQYMDVFFLGEFP